MTARLSNRALFTWLFIEEWRLHARLFGGARFAFVPLVLLAGSAVAYRLLVIAAVTPDTIVLGLHAVAVLVGLQVGTVALVGRDMIENLLGETTVLLSSVRTLPISGRRLLGVFLFKDVCYYALLYIAPVAIGLAALLDQGITLLDVAVAWTTITAAFTVGVATSTALVGLASRNRPVTLLLVATAVLALYVNPGIVAAYSPYAIYADHTPIAVGTTGGLVVALAAIGYHLVDLTRQSTTRTTPNQYHWLRHRLPGHTPWLVAKAILDVTRSTGGYAKVVVSMALVVVIVGGVLEGVTRAIGLTPAAGPAFAGLLALASFTTYNWLTTVDDADIRRALPVHLTQVFWSVLTAHLILSLPPATALLLVAAWWFGPAGLVPGLLALPGLFVYVVGVTAYTTGLHPGERLFDAGRFALFGIAAAIVAVPVLLAAFTAPSVDLPISWLVTAGSFVAGCVGLVLVYWAGPRWTAADRHAGTG